MFNFHIFTIITCYNKQRKIASKPECINQSPVHVSPSGNTKGALKPKSHTTNGVAV